MASYSAGLLNVGTLDATGVSATLQANTANVTTLTATTVNATNFNNPNLNVTGTSTVQGQQVGLAAGGWNNLPTKTLPNTMKIVLQSCENTCGDIVSRKMKTVLNQNLVVLPNTVFPQVINGLTTFDQAMHEQMCGYVASLNPDTFIHTGDSGYTDNVAAAGMDGLIFNYNSENYGDLPPGIKTLIGYTDNSGNSGPFFKAMQERALDNGSEMWVQSLGGQLIRKQVEPKGGFHVVWDDHDVGANDMGAIPENGAYAGRQFYKNKLNGWSAKNIVDGYDASGNVLTIATKLDASGNPRFYYNGDVYNPSSTSLTPPSIAQVSTIYRSWDQELDYNDGTGNKFNIRFIIMDDQHFDGTTGATYVQDIHNPRGFAPIFYPNSPPLTNTTATPYYPSDGSENRVNTDFPDLSGFTAPRFSDSSGNKFEYFADPRYTETRNFFGDKQLNWAFDKILGASSYDLIVIVTGSPLWMETYGQDTLCQYTYERKMIANFIRENKVDNLIFTSGDTHFNYVSQKLNVAGYPIYDIVSSGVSQGVSTTFQDAPFRDCVWGPDWNQPMYKDPATGSIWRNTPLGFGPSLGVSGNSLYNQQMYQFMTMDIILPGSVDSVRGDRFVDTNGDPITTPTVRLTQHYAQNIGVLSQNSQPAAAPIGAPAATAMGQINAATGQIAGVGPWRASENVYDIPINTLTHSYWENQTIPQHFDASGSPYSYWKTNPCNDQIVKDASGNKGKSPLSDPMVPWNRGVPTQVSTSPIVDVSGNYLTDVAGNFLQIPMDILCEIIPVKHNVTGQFLDLSGNVITATCYIPQYHDKVNKANFIVFDSSNDATYSALATTDLSGYPYDQICKWSLDTSGANPYTPSNLSFTAGSNTYYKAYYDGSANGPALHITSPNWYVYGSPTVDYSPTNYGLRYKKANPGVIQTGYNFSNIAYNPMCPYVEDVTVSPDLSGFLFDYLLTNAGTSLNVSDKIGLASIYYASFAANVFNSPTSVYPTFNRKYFITVTRDPSGVKVTSEPTRTFQLPINPQNTNANFHAGLLTIKDIEVFAKSLSPIPTAFGFSTDLFGTTNTVQGGFGPWFKQDNIMNNNGFGDLEWIDGYGAQQHDKTLAALCGAAGYVGETPTFTFYSTDVSGNNRYELGTVNYKLKYKNNTIFSNVPGSTQYNYGGYADGNYVDSIDNQAGTASTIFYELYYQQFSNVMRRMCYGTENLGKNMVKWPGVKVCNSTGLDAVDSAGLYTVIFTDSSHNVDWDIWTDNSGNPVYTFAPTVQYTAAPTAGAFIPALASISGVGAAGFFGTVPILQWYNLYPATGTLGVDYVHISTNFPDLSPAYTNVKVPVNTLHAFRQVRFKNIGTSPHMTNLWYENNKLTNALYTCPLGSGNTAKGYTDASFQVFTDPSGGFTGLSKMPQLGIPLVATQNTIWPAPTPPFYAARALNVYGSLAYNYGAGSMKRTTLDIYKAFNERYYANFPNTFVGNGGGGQKINSQTACSSVLFSCN